MGTLYFRDGKIEDSIAAFEKVIALDPEFANTPEILKQLYSQIN
jgi:tetratricopeptide (TPR) repeat protein